MPKKNKQPFWILSIIFAAITLLTLGMSFGYGQKQEASMMSDSMGNMMSSMHLQNITIGDLIRQQENMEVAQAQNQDHSSHHEGADDSLKKMHYLTTGTIVILMPIILAGTIFLSILWFGKTGKGGV